MVVKEPWEMLSRKGAIACLALLGILLVSFFPANIGPFTVTNGPATAFRALEAAIGLFDAIGTAVIVAIVPRCILFLPSATHTPVGQLTCDPALVSLRC
jgi:hypothetical protein